MAISSYTGNELVPNTDTFDTWLTRTNTIIGDMASVVVTEGNNNPFDVEIDGVFSVSNTVFVDTLSGGTQGSPGALDISSNTEFSGANISFSSSANATFLSNVSITGATKTINISTANAAISSTKFNVSSNTSFSNTVLFSDVATFSDNVSITGATKTINISTANAAISSTKFNVSSNTSFSNTVLFSDDVTLTANAVANNVTTELLYVNDRFKVPVRTTGGRPGTPVEGDIGRNTTTGQWEGYDGSNWGNLGGAGLFKGENGETGDTVYGAGDIFRVNEQTLNTDVTIDADENASTTGPLTVSSGVTLTVTSGGNLRIV